jgi:hypothetical protein
VHPVRFSTITVAAGHYILGHAPQCTSYCHCGWRGRCRFRPFWWEGPAFASFGNRTWSIPKSAWLASSGDLNGDGKVDLAVASKHGVFLFSRRDEMSVLAVEGGREHRERQAGLGAGVFDPVRQA